MPAPAPVKEMASQKKPGERNRPIYARRRGFGRCRGELKRKGITLKRVLPTLLSYQRRACTYKEPRLHPHTVLNLCSDPLILAFESTCLASGTCHTPPRTALCLQRMRRRLRPACLVLRRRATAVAASRFHGSRPGPAELAELCPKVGINAV